MDHSTHEHGLCPLCHVNVGSHFMYSHLRADHRVKTAVGLRYLMCKSLGNNSPLVADGNSTQKNICRFVIQRNNCSNLTEALELCKIATLGLERFCCNYEADLNELEDDVKEALLEDLQVHHDLSVVWSRRSNH